MKVVRLNSFSYSEEMATAWKGEIFQPVRDTKLQIELKDGLKIEAAAFELQEDGSSEIHACISTQAGCKFGCHFCQSGINGYRRNLSTTEILEQIALVAKSAGTAKLDHIIYMGIGEPLDNFDNVVESVNLLHVKSDYRNKISLATVGVPENLIRLGKTGLPFRTVWLSLHAPNDKKRAEIMPIGKVHGIHEVIVAGTAYARASKNETWLNYMILHGFNDNEADAADLARLLMNTEDALSVLLSIPNGKVDGYESGTMENVRQFEHLLKEAGLKNQTARFFAAGQSVNAGCGEFIFYPNQV